MCDVRGQLTPFAHLERLHDGRMTLATRQTFAAQISSFVAFFVRRYSFRVQLRQRRLS